MPGGVSRRCSLLFPRLIRKAIPYSSGFAVELSIMSRVLRYLAGSRRPSSLGARSLWPSIRRGTYLLPSPLKAGQMPPIPHTDNFHHLIPLGCSIIVDSSATDYSSSFFSDSHSAPTAIPHLNLKFLGTRYPTP